MLSCQSPAIFHSTVSSPFHPQQPSLQVLIIDQDDVECAAYAGEHEVHAHGDAQGHAAHAQIQHQPQLPKTHQLLTLSHQASKGSSLNPWISKKVQSLHLHKTARPLLNLTSTHRYNAGSEVYTQTIAMGLQTKGVQVSVFSREEDPFKPDYTITLEHDALLSSIPVHIINHARSNVRYLFTVLIE